MTVINTAKSFAAMTAVNLSDKQHAIFVDKLAELLTTVTNEHIAKELERYCRMAMREPRSEYWRGYIAGLCDVLAENCNCNEYPRWYLMARSWYK